MKKAIVFTLLMSACVAVLSAGAANATTARTMSQRYSPNDYAAAMNRDGYPYTVLSRGPILPPEEKRKIKRNLVQYEKYLQAREQDKVRQFRAMSAQERRYVIQREGYPAGILPGYD